MEWWAHRGSGKGAGENTLKAFQVAVDAGFTALEFDVMLSADGVPHIHHDWFTGRCATSIREPSQPPVPIASLTSAQLQGYQVSGEPMPQLREVLSFCLRHGLHTNVELKARHPAEARRLGAVVRQVMLDVAHEHRLADADVVRRFVFSSFYHASLLPLQGWSLGLLYEEPLPDDWIVHADALRASAIHLHYPHATPDALRRIHTTGRVVRVFTVNDAAMAERLAALGVAGLFTDNMAFARAL